MKNSEAHTDRSKAEGRGHYRKEWAVALFSLLMATALPALAVMIAGLSVRSEEGHLTEETVVCFCRHENGTTEELTLGRLIALSLAATNPSDTPAASLEAQAILLRSRGVWWMDYCGAVDDIGGSMAEKDLEEQASASKYSKNTSDVEENSSELKKDEENGMEVQKNEDSGERMKQAEKNKADAHPILCDSPVHGLPYLSYEELTDLWGGEETESRLIAAEKAVEMTRGQVLCYDGEVVPALLHHSSGGVTRSVESLPWLASVPTPETGGEAVYRFSAEEVRHSLAAGFGLLLPADPTLWALSVHTSPDGRAETVEVTGEHLSGTAFAEALSLPSTTFSVQVNTDTLTFVCTGVGSGCGLSREGAAIYALGGLNCGEILAHYYPDCTVGVMGKGK